jgi:SAM-dependent methyltransferase
MDKDYEKGIDFGDPNDSHAMELDLIGRNKRVVDFGCWTGLVAGELKRRGCYVTGIERDTQAARVAEGTCDRVIVADLDQADLAELLEGETYDVGLFGDVIEHLARPERVLRGMRDLLNPGGYIVVSVPNITHANIRLMLLEGRFDYSDTGILDDTHLKYFTRQSIADLLESCRYMVESMDWVKKEVTEERVRGVLDPLGLSNLEEVVKSFSHWEAVAFQWVIKAFPAGEEERVQKLSEEKVQAERKLRELTEQLEEFERVKEEMKRVRAESEKIRSESDGVRAESEHARVELDKVGDYVRSLEAKIDEKDAYIASLEAAQNERAGEIAELNRRIQELSSGESRGRRRDRK